MKANTQRKNERGAIIVEIIAVIALLGVMGPLLFRQVNTRNEEIENINIASEMRTLKEAFSAFILSEKSRLLSNFQGASECETGNQYKNDIAAFLPEGNEAYEGYNFYLCKTSQTYNSTNPNKTNVMLMGLISPKEQSMPERVRLRRAARIANLIGADGAVCQEDDQGMVINGVAGGWGLDDTLNICNVSNGDTMYLVTTGMDTYIPEVTFEDYSASLIALPNKLALQDLHAWNYFSVGNGTSNCYKLNHNKTGNYSAEKGYTATDDEIYDAGNGCDPLFWVSSVSGGEKSEGNVYVKNSLMIGQRTDGGSVSRAAIGLFKDMDDTTNLGTYSPDNSDGNRIVVYDNTGRERIEINGKGEIIAKGAKSDGNEDTETLKMTNQSIESNIAAEYVNSNYKVDPAYTSVMKDIRLDARNGARLSEILPNYISKGVHSILNGSGSVKMPDCPTGYAPAMIVIPTGYDAKAKLKSSDIADTLEIDAAGLSVDENGNVLGTENIRIKPKGGNVEAINGGLRVVVNGFEGGYAAGDTSGNAGNWTVRLYEKDSSTTSQDLRAIAQTYCVYDKNFDGGWSNGKSPSLLDLDR